MKKSVNYAEFIRTRKEEKKNKELRKQEEINLGIFDKEAEQKQKKRKEIKAFAKKKRFERMYGSGDKVGITGGKDNVGGLGRFKNGRLVLSQRDIAKIRSGSSSDKYFNKKKRSRR